LGMQHQMESALQEKEAEIIAQQAEGDRLQETIKKRQQRIELFHADLYRLVKEEQDVRNWPQCIKRIYKDHMEPTCIAKDAEQSIPMEELRRQGQLMEKKVKQLALNKATTEDRCKSGIQSKTTENSLLIHELNLLRVEQKALQRQVKDLLLACKMAQVKNVEKQVALQNKHSQAPAMLMGTSPSDPNMLQLGDLFGKVPSGSGLPPQRPSSGKAPRTRQVAASSSNNATRRSTHEFAGGDKKQRPDNHVDPADKRKMQQLLAKADLNQQQIEMQALENKILRDQVTKLTMPSPTIEDPGGAGPAEVNTAIHVAGAAHKAVRQATR